MCWNRTGGQRASRKENELKGDPEVLVGLSEDELEALADCQLSPPTQGRLDELLERNTAGHLGTDEQIELDRLLAMVDQLTILKTRARYTLARQAGATMA